jgi:hypothetical protein
MPRRQWWAGEHWWWASGQQRWAVGYCDAGWGLCLGEWYGYAVWERQMNWGMDLACGYRVVGSHVQDGSFNLLFIISCADLETPVKRDLWLPFQLSNYPWCFRYGFERQAC